MRKRLAVALIAGVALSASAVASLASVVVMESRSPNLKRGDELTDDTTIEVAFGTRLLVAVPQGGEFKTVEIKGPRKGRVKELLQPESISTRLLKLASEYARTGGTSLKSTASARGARLLVNNVAVSEQSTICVEQGALPPIALASGLEKASVRLIDARNSQQSREVVLSPATPRAAWPSSVALRNDGTYQLLEEGQSRVDLTVKIVPNGTLSNPSWVRSLETLDKAGCEEQLRTALRGIFEKP